MAKRNPAKTEMTRKRIEDAFWGLYLNSESGQVTASAVAKEAGVNRSTFYAYFHDTDEILESIESDLLEYLEKWASRVAATDDYAETAGIARSIFEEKGELLRVFLGKRRSGRILGKARGILGGLVLREMLGVEDEPSDPMRYRAEFIAVGIIGAYIRWLEDGRPVPIEDVAGILKASALAAARAERPDLTDEGPCRLRA